MRVDLAFNTARTFGPTARAVLNDYLAGRIGAAEASVRLGSPGAIDRELARVFALALAGVAGARLTVRDRSDPAPAASRPDPALSPIALERIRGGAFDPEDVARVAIALAAHAAAEDLKEASHVVRFVGPGETAAAAYVPEIVIRVRRQQGD
jgi:hypothetical protein